ncbi:hypothetical protein YM304_12360 [Ilumatobacter coccineus YM16-304]|uniref:Uncharacterized protein n=1 Tax=Ilumatobacter coccineus (strain NBRC 103263 / KCTC 29153 / YM16-304) TaxID=1313172 RepID=A0A6C7E4K8_ILUCY|nr:hypothetical protein YM304_12360 [Ilumatobacter coccineus YM16-304]
MTACWPSWISRSSRWVPPSTNRVERGGRAVAWPPSLEVGESAPSGRGSPKSAPATR